ncbi:MAG: DUF3108 domain-containing protein [Gammaproteobacteria bacterium]|nr:DUF3108 domain-containing protein [Gammaproteobacteria bacterium]
MHALTHLFTVLLLLSSSAYGFQLPDSFRAEYRLEKYNTTVAEMTLQLSQQNQQYIYTSVTQAYGMAALFSDEQAQETSTLQQNDNQQQAYLSKYEFDRKNKTSKNQRIDLNWSEHDQANISGFYGNKKYQLQHQGMLWDRLSVQLALTDDIRRTADIPHGYVFSYKVIDRGEISNYQFSYEGKQNIQLGKYYYNAVKLKREHGSGNKDTILWLAEELDFAPVKIEQFKKGKLHMNMELVHFTRQKP